jgi:hypothetical protein
VHERRFAGAVVADDPDAFAGGDIQAHAVQRSGRRQDFFAIQNFEFRGRVRREPS